MSSPTHPCSSSTTANEEANTNGDCTLAYIRALTAPLIVPPSREDLRTTLLTPWNVRLPVDTSDPITCVHWRDQKHTALFEKMMDWNGSSSSNNTCTVKLQPYLSFSENYSTPFFVPHEDVAHCLKHLLLHQVGSHQSCTSLSLISRETEVFLATAHNFDEEELNSMNINESYYLLRCHYDKVNEQLVFGYHLQHDRQTFHQLEKVCFADEDWRLITCILLTNTARILNCLIHYAVPLSCSPERCIVDGCVQKIYKQDTICGIFNATVDNMVSIYEAIADVPGTDRLVSTEERVDNNEGKRQQIVICKFAPIGRSYLPVDAGELLEALICVTGALVSLHSKGIMHRDIRWANVFHALQVGHEKFTREWVLFDFEFAAMSPQPALGEHTLTPGNHAPEMIQTVEDNTSWTAHTTAVDIWGIGYLLANANVDLPLSHAADLLKLQEDCMKQDPDERPSARECLERLKQMQSRSFSKEKDIVYL